MREFPEITGSIIQAYLICPRQAWLLSRNINGDFENTFLAEGRFNAEKSFEREKKEVNFHGNVFDIVRQKEGKLIVVEVKKSTKALGSAKMQLLYYLYLLKQRGFSADGEIRVPEEKAVIKVVLDREGEQKLLSLREKILETINKPVPPLPDDRGYCNNCSYNAFCWS